MTFLQLNKAIWARGLKHVPHRVRVRLSRQRSDDEDAAEKLYTTIELVEGVTSFKGEAPDQPGLRTTIVRADE